MAMNVSSNYSSMFQAMNGKYNFSSDMSSVISQSSQIRNGSYAKLMKSYVNKVGNQNALKAFRETGTTVQSAQDINSSSTSSTSSSTSASTSTSATKKPTFLDNYLSGKMGSVTKTSTNTQSATSTDSTASTSGTTASTGTQTSTSTQTSSASSTTDKYAALKSSWLDNQLKGYSSTGTQTVMADPAIAINTGV